MNSTHRNDQIVIQRTDHDCWICSVASVTGLAYEQVPRWRKYGGNTIKKFMERFIEDMARLGFYFDHADAKPVNGIALYCFKDERSRCPPHAVPIIGGVEYDIDRVPGAMERLRECAKYDNNYFVIERLQ
jgi:hypothetical protein